MSPAEHLAEQTALTLVAGAGLPLALVVLGVRGQAPAWVAVVAAAAGWWTAEASLHARAERARDELRHTLSIMLSLLSISLARGAGIEQALDEATSVCSGPAAGRITDAIASARVLRRPPWEPLGRLGRDTGVTELEELAASMALAGTDGARIRASLTARAAAIRTAATARAHATAEKATSRMALPLLGLGMAYLVFLLYPALASLQLSP
jgi:Flp pilus assembly protein TadB